jgi:hypothetical protein
MTLWFNLRTSSSLGNINLSMDTLLTSAQTHCGSGIISGNSLKFGLPHNVVVYLNGGNGYTNNIDGLFHLANDVLGGVNTMITPLNVQDAIAAINSAFDGCRILTGTLPYIENIPLITTNNSKKISEKALDERLIVKAFPDPYDKEFNLSIVSPVSGKAIIEFFDVKGTRIYKVEKFVFANAMSILPYKGPTTGTSILYSVRIDNYHASGFVIHPN